jgi:hypothetical protein
VVQKDTRLGSSSEELDMRFPLSLRKIGALNFLAAAMIGALAFKAPAAEAMTFQKIVGPAECAQRECVLASGPVDRQSIAGFQEMVRTHRIAPGALLVLNSQGGVLLYAIRLGEEVRKAGFSTTVAAYEPGAAELQPGECSSACAFVFLGGVERAVFDGSKVGVHQIYANLQARDGLSVGDVQLLTSLCAMHIDNMGGGVGILIEALRTPPEEVHWFSIEEMTRLAVTTPRRALTLAAN